MFSSQSSSQDEYPTRTQLKANAQKAFGVPPESIALSKDGLVWIDKKNKRLIVDGYVTLTQGQLEMFACPVGTKEHESIVALFGEAQEIHAGLLAIGAKQGSPTQFEPYKAASGSTIKVSVLWRGPKNEKMVKPAQSWILDLQHNHEMTFDWVFAGSVVHKDPDTGEQIYMGDSGDLLCVANFPTAVLDIAVQSIASNDALVYGAYTERIPPLFTVCRLVLEVSDAPPNQSRTLPKAPSSTDANASPTSSAGASNPTSPGAPKSDSQTPDADSKKAIEPSPSLDTLFGSPK